jgi:hypothetical protein
VALFRLGPIGVRVCGSTLATGELRNTPEALEAATEAAEAERARGAKAEAAATKKAAERGEKEEKEAEEAALEAERKEQRRERAAEARRDHEDARKVGVAVQVENSAFCPRAFEYLLVHFRAPIACKRLVTQPLRL